MGTDVSYISSLIASVITFTALASHLIGKRIDDAKDNQSKQLENLRLSMTDLTATFHDGLHKRLEDTIAQLHKTETNLKQDITNSEDRLRAEILRSYYQDRTD